MFTKISDWKIFEAKTKKMGEYDLVIVDVQEPFKKFFGEAYLKALEEYCEDFSRVFQIYDTINIDEPDYLFPNQTLTIAKEYGGELNEEDVEYYFTEPMREAIYQKFQEGFQERDMFETINGDYFIYVDGDHEWFLCRRDMADLFKGFKSNGRKIILVGGAANECLKDIYVTMRAFDVTVEYNAQYVYSAKGSQYQKQVSESAEFQNLNIDLYDYLEELEPKVLKIFSECTGASDLSIQSDISEYYGEVDEGLFFDIYEEGNQNNIFTFSFIQPVLYNGKKYIPIDAIYVDEKYRRMGIYTAMLKLLHTFALEIGLDGIISFYRNIGNTGDTRSNDATNTWLALSKKLSIQKEEADGGINFIY